MGFPFAFVKVATCLNLNLFIKLLTTLKLTFLATIARVGLYKPPQETFEEAPLWSGYIFILDGSCPVQVPIYVVKSKIKSKLHVVQYGTFLEKSRVDRKHGEEDEGMCAVCLERVEESDEIRELCNCSHLFHRECLDRWVDTDRVTCPCCRTILCPVNSLGSSVVRILGL